MNVKGEGGWLITKLRLPSVSLLEYVCVRIYKKATSVFNPIFQCMKKKLVANLNPSIYILHQPFRS